jgi:hypothetical protein
MSETPDQFDSRPLLDEGFPTLRLTCPYPGVAVADLFARSYLRLRNTPFLRGTR